MKLLDVAFIKCFMGVVLSIGVLYFVSMSCLALTLAGNNDFSERDESIPLQ
jgi:hypothetical protein